MALPSCECVKGLPIGEQLAAIYCATYTLAAGDVDGPYLLKAANLSDVDDPDVSRVNLEAAGSPDGFANFIGQTASRSYTIPDVSGVIPVAILKIKPLDTSRSNMAVAADDPDLIQVLPPGVYTVDVVLAVNNASVAPGFRFQLATTGGSSVATGELGIYADGNAGNVVQGVGPNQFIGTMAGILFGTGSIAASQDYGAYMTFSLVVTATTTLSVQWAQNTSSGDAARVKANSYMKILRYS